MNGFHASTSPNPKSVDLAKVLKSFTLLEKEFNVDSSDKLDECLSRLQPPVTFQDSSNGSDNNSQSNCAASKNVSPNDKELYENVIVSKSANSTVQTSDTPLDSDYENVLVTSNSDQQTYENVEIKTPPTPLPRQATAVAVEPKVRSMVPAAVVAPLPRSKSKDIRHDDFDEVHECKVVTDENGNQETIENTDLPRLINFLPKVLAIDTKHQKYITNYSLINEDTDQVDGIPPVKKCIRVASDHDDNYVDSSSSSSDEDEEKIYEPGAMEKRGDSSSEVFSDEDGEKLGPPEYLNTPGPSEAYFNFHWSPNMLPTIGEVEEELSSLEPNTG